MQEERRKPTKQELEGIFGRRPIRASEPRGEPVLIPWTRRAGILFGTRPFSPSDRTPLFTRLGGLRPRPSGNFRALVNASLDKRRGKP